MTIVSGPMSGGSIASAASVSYSFTVKNTMSTGPTDARIVGRRHARHMNVAAGAFDAQAVFAHRGQMRAARDECHIDARRRQPAAEISADAAAADNRNPHGAHSIYFFPVRLRGHDVTTFRTQSGRISVLQRADVNIFPTRTNDEDQDRSALVVRDRTRDRTS